MKPSNVIHVANLWRPILPIKCQGKKRERNKYPEAMYISVTNKPDGLDVTTRNRFFFFFFLKNIVAYTLVTVIKFPDSESYMYALLFHFPESLCGFERGR